MTGPAAVTGADRPEWLALLAAAPLERLYVWQPPRLINERVPHRQTGPRRAHARRYAHAVSVQQGAPPRWIPFPARPGHVPAGAGGEPSTGDYVAISWMLQRRPGRWAVVYVGDKSTSSRVRSAVIGQRHGFAQRVGVFQAVVRSVGGGLWLTHVRFTPNQR